MVMADVRIGVVPGSTGDELHLRDFAHRDELAQRIVDGRAGYFGYSSAYFSEDFVGREVSVWAGKHFRHDSPLDGHPPVSTAQSVDEECHLPVASIHHQRAYEKTTRDERWLDG